MPDDDKVETYEDRTKDDLLTEARDRGLDVASGAKKEEVIAALEEDDKAKLGTAAAPSEDEPYGEVEYVGPDGLVCDVLLPYMQDRGDLQNGKTYSAPVSVIRQVVLNGNFVPYDGTADDLLHREERRSAAGQLRAQRLLASPVASGETAKQFDQRVGIANNTVEEQRERVKSATDDLFEAPEYDPMAEFLAEEG